MKLNEISSHTSEWFGGSGPLADVVVSSRVRLARNVAGFQFLSHCSVSQKAQILEKLKDAVMNLDLGDNVFYVGIDKAPVLDKDVLVERHLISRHHAHAKGPRGVVIASREFFTAMINEEDHLRIQVFKAGLQLRDCWKQISEIDDMIEQKIDYAFHPRYGYLTACPTNVGTALRASVMLHLPGLVFVNQINQVLQAIVKLGLAVRGLYGEGTEASGNLFQISNQVTLGITEEDIVTNLQKVINQIIGHEKKARQALYQKNRKALEDRVCRAYGLLSSARIISSKETIDLLSTLKLGLDFQLVDFDLGSINELFIITQPAHLQKQAGKELKPEERDILRADLIREKLWAKKKREKGNKS